MPYIAAFILFVLCFAGMALGLIVARKVLRKGCSLDPDDPASSCACRDGQGDCRRDSPLH